MTSLARLAPDPSTRLPVRRVALAALPLVAAAAVATAQGAPQRATAIPAPQPPIEAITGPRNPLPSEAATARVTKFSFIVYGDTRNSNDGVIPQKVHGQVVDSVLQTIRALAKGPDPVRFVLQTGDAVVSGQSSQQLNVSFLPIINRITTDAGLPYFLAAGNHDVTGAADLKSPGRVTGLANMLGANRNLIPAEGTPRRLAGYPTYAFGFGNTFFLAFDSNIAADSTQFAWVRAQLEGLDRRRFPNIIVFCHHPAYSSGPHGGVRIEPPTQAIRERYMPLLRRHHVRLLLVGHEHLFDQWLEYYRDASGTHRIDEFVTGGGGAPLYVYTGEPDVSAYLAAGAEQQVRLTHIRPPAADTAQNPHHYLVVHVNGTAIRVEAVGVTGPFSPFPAGGWIIPATKRP
jgi:hypothetical protein